MSAFADFDQQTRDLYHASHVQHLQRPMLRSRRSTAMELAANQSKTVSQSQTIPAFVKDIPVYCMRPRRLVTFASSYVVGYLQVCADAHTVWNSLTESLRPSSYVQ